MGGRKMKILMSFLLVLSIAICFSNIPAGAAEHGGKEHGGTTAEKEHGGKEQGDKEHGGAKISEPSADQIRGAISAYFKKK